MTGPSFDLTLFGLSILLPVLLTILLVARAFSLMFREPRSVEWKDFPEYDALALRMQVRLPPPKRWGVARIGGVARTNAIRGQVIFDSKSFFKLTPEERLAITAHELGHIKARHSLFAALILFCGTAVAIILALEGEALLPTIAWFAFFFLMVYYRRRGEYQADLAAARFVQPTSMISALLRFQSPTRKYERFLGGLTHPPTGTRIERLRGSSLHVESRLGLVPRRRLQR